MNLLLTRLCPWGHRRLCLGSLLKRECVEAFSERRMLGKKTAPRRSRLNFTTLCAQHSF